MKPRTRGRPPLDRADRSVDIHLRVPSRHYDAMYAEAQRDRVTIPGLIRRAIGNRRRQFRDSK